MKKLSILGLQLSNNLSTNQFGQTNVVGKRDLTSGCNNVMNMQFNPEATETLTLIPGEGVKLVDLGAGDFYQLPIVDKRTAITDVIDGVVLYDFKKATKSPGDIVGIAKRGMVVTFEASEVLARGASVELLVSTHG